MSDDAPQSVRDWLAGIGLEQYAESFESHAIALDVLPAIGDAELDRLGVRLLGHRLRLAHAINALRVGAPAAVGQPALPGSGPERRQLTVMFCDLVGSTALSQELDPEDLRLLMQRYQRICRAAVERHAGHVAQYLGDGIMVYFGWPRAHEDDAQRALQTALEIIDAVKAIAAARPPRVRIGIATGPVVVGEAADGDVTLPKTAIGETPNVAARVQALAEPDEILIAATTRRLVADAFECEDRGQHALKGISQPQHIWRVLGVGRADGRFAAAHGGRLTPLVNRELEVSLLLDRWARARRGEGQAVLLLGEPGIGKSRAVAELCAYVGDGSVLVRAQCSELHSNSAFYPVITQLQRAAGFERDDSTAARLDKVEALIQRNGAALAPIAPHLAALLSLPLDRYPPLQTSPQKQKRDIIDALVALIIESSRQSPVLLVFEDLHWMDPSTMEVLDALLAALDNARLLLLMSSRRALGDRWAGHARLTTHTLGSLNRGHSLKLAVAVAVRHGLPQQVLERIVEHTDGVPLFVEEVTRTLLDNESLRVGSHATLPQARLDAIEIPATLKDSLTARLDQLGAARRCAQLGAVLGRQFRHDAVLALSGLPEAVLREQLSRLVAAGLLSAAGDAASPVYTFHHALVQDAAYETLLRSDRRALHARAAEALTQTLPELAEAEPELLARHYSAGEVYDKAVPLWLKAGQRAWQRSAAKEAIAQLGAGLALLHHLPEGPARDSLELRLQSALGVVYFAAVSYAAPQARDAFERANSLCERVPETALKVPVLYGIGAFETMKGDIRAGHEAFTKLLAEAEASGQPRLRLYTQAVLTWSHYNCGHYAASLAAAEEAAALYASGALAGPRLSAADPLIISECFRALSLWAVGRVDEARAGSDGVLAHARALRDPYSLAYALNFATLQVPELCGEHDLVLARSEEGVQLASEIGYPFLAAMGTQTRAWVQGQVGDPEEALAAMDGALERCRALGVRYNYPLSLSRRAQLLLRAGRVGEAQLDVAQGLAQVASSGERSNEVAVYLAEGDVQAARGGGQAALAAAAYQLGLELALEQGAHSWAVRAACALADTWRHAGRHDAARALLQARLAALPAAQPTADTRLAAALLAALR